MATKTSEPLTIAHLSDLHVGDHDETIWTRLQESLRRHHPNLIVITGDLVETPKQETFASALIKLGQLCTDAQVRNEDVYFAPGNHDYRVKGLIWWTYRLALPFAASSFPKWLQPSGAGFFDKENRIALFVFDSNFSPDLFNAGGKIGRNALRNFKAYCDQFEKYPEYRDSLKVVLLHHHPLPIPYSDQFERFMVLDDAGEFLRHMFQCGVHLILHGHKHHRASSVVTLQDPYGKKRELYVVACPSATKRISEVEHRGYNLIKVHKSNRLEFVSLDYTPGVGFESPKTPSLSTVFPSPEAFIKQHHESQIKNGGYRIGTFLRHITIDEDGDALERVHISGLEATRHDPSVTIHPFQIYAGAGQVKRPTFQPHGTPIKCRIDEATGLPPQGCTFTIEPDDQWQQGTKAYDFEFSAWSLNSIALNEIEFNSKYERLQNDREEYWEHEFEEIGVRRPIDSFIMVIQFPPHYALATPPRLKIYRYDSAGSHPWAYHQSETWLEEYYKYSLAYTPSLSQITLSLTTPPAGRVYRIYWPVPTKAPHSPRREHYAMKLQAGLLQLRGNDAITQLLQDIAEKIRRSFSTSELIDVTLMARYEEANSNIAKLKVIGANLPPGSPMWDHTLFVGDSIPGRAFKSGKIWSFISLDENLQAKPTGYIPIAPGSSHAVLHAVPLLYQDHTGPTYGVVLVGSRQDSSVLVFKKQEYSARRLELAKIVYETVVVPLHNLCEIPLVSDD